MTLDQFQMYTKAVYAIDKREMRSNVISATAGARYDEKSLENLYRKLEEE
jgi:hypothetical protein